MIQTEVKVALVPLGDDMPTFDNVNKPIHYTDGQYECWDVMKDVFGKDELKAFCRLNAFKYIWRSEKKNGVEDIRKAVVYINKLIELETE